MRAKANGTCSHPLVPTLTIFACLASLPEGHLVLPAYYLADVFSSPLRCMSFSARSSICSSTFAKA
jgi:hypothetical protein